GKADSTEFPGDAGVSGKGPIGVVGEGTSGGRVQVGVIGVVGKADRNEFPTDVGVSGKGPVGVRGEGSTSGGVGHSEEGTGIVGQSEKGNAGSFSSKLVAQIHLEPLLISTPVGTVRGNGGDLLATKDPEGNTTPWFCAGDGDATKAVWKQIA